MSEPGLMDVTGRLRSPAATPGHWAGCAPPARDRRITDGPTPAAIESTPAARGRGRDP